MSANEGERPTRGRPRKEGAEERILEAAIEEYGERGWAGFTMDAVARRAGVGKSTVYLRWSNKDDLLTEAVRVRSSGIEAVDTGSFRGDLEALAANLYRHLLDPSGWATLRITVDAAGSPEPLGRFTNVVTQQHRVAFETLIGRAVTRGEATTDVPATTLIECLYGAIITQTLGLTGASRTLVDEDIDERVRPVVAFVLAGAGL